MIWEGGGGAGGDDAQAGGGGEGGGGLGGHEGRVGAEEGEEEVGVLVVGRVEG